jgi:biopolymer transport protein ExbD
MRRPKPRVLPSGPDLTPVVNIAMVILVVFMLATTFVEPQLYMQSRVALMERGGRTQLPPDWTPPTALPILVNMDPQTPGSFSADVGAQQVADPGALEEVLRGQYELFRTTDTDMEKVQVEISPQSHVIWQHLITVYEAAQRAGFTNVTFTPGR